MAGFSIFQPTLGAALQWLPALGTPELDDMINAVFPGPASMQEKRATISIDFFEFSQQTGQNFKYYAAPVSFAPATVPSPASSAGLYDSAYGSNFNVSPVLASSASPWPQSPATFASSFDEPKVASRATPSKKPSTSSSRQSADFANHPGMRIMTKDGRDVTNSASRGCKTKEQRDHAHLMRIIKACDACKRKKVRCDPSHRKRTAGSSSAPQAEPKAAKRVKKRTAESPPVPPVFMPDLFASSMFETPEAAPSSSSSSFESSPESVDDLWTQFVMFDQEPMQLPDDFTIDDYSFFNDPQNLLTPSSIDSSTSPSQWFSAPFTPAPPGPSPPVEVSEALSSDLVSPGTTPPDVQPDGLIVPYLNPGVPHGTNYADFNLFAPPLDFFLDEEPLPAKKALASAMNQLQSSRPALHTASPAQQSASPDSGAFARVDGYCSSRRSSLPSDGSKPQSSGGLDEHIHRPTPVSRCPMDGCTRASVPTPLVSSMPAQSSLSSQQTRLGQGRLASTMQNRSLPTVSAQQAENEGNRATTAAAATSTLISAVPRSSPRDSSAGRHHIQLSDAELRWCTPTSQSPTTPSGHSSAYDGSLSAYAGATQASCPRAPTESHAVMQSGLIRQCRLDLSATVALATTLIATSPMQRFAGKGYKDVEQPTPSSTLVQLAVLGLVSSLLAVALQAQSPGYQADFHVVLNLIIITIITCTRLFRRRSELPVAATSEPVAIVTTIDNVKTKIQAVGQQINGLRCVASRQAEAVMRRLPSPASVKL